MFTGSFQILAGTGTGIGCATPAPPVVIDPKESGKCPIDLLLIIDTSGSVEGDFNQERQFAVDVADKFLGGDYITRVRVAAIRFEGTAVLVSPFGGQTTKAGVLEMLNAIKHTGGSTSALSALNIALSEIRANAREEADLVVLHISDGNSIETIDRFQQVAKQIRDQGATIFAATFSRVCEVCRQELEAITGSKNRVYVESRAPLLSQELVSFANSDKCLQKVVRSEIFRYKRRYVSYEMFYILLNYNFSTTYR